MTEANPDHNEHDRNEHDRNELVDMVNNPPHYLSLYPVWTVDGLVHRIEVADVSEAFDLPHHLSSAVEYILRAHRKHDQPFEDLNKAIWWLRRYIQLLQRKEQLRNLHELMDQQENQ